MLSSFPDQKEFQSFISSIPEPVALESSFKEKEKWISKYIKWWGNNFEIKEAEDYEDYEENSTD